MIKEKNFIIIVEFIMMVIFAGMTVHGINGVSERLQLLKNQMDQLEDSVDELLNIVTEMRFPSDGNLYVSEKQQFFWDEYLSEEIPLEGTLFFESPYCGELKNEEGSSVYVLRAQQGLLYTKKIPKISIVEQE